MEALTSQKTAFRIRFVQEEGKLNDEPGKTLGPEILIQVSLRWELLSMFYSAI
jgi:hypothetical protein